MFWTGEKHRDGTDPSHGNAPRARAVGDSAGVPFTLSISLSAPVDGRAQLTARSRRCFCSKARLLDRRFANATNSGSSVEFCQIQSVCRVIARRRARSSFLRYFQRIDLLPLFSSPARLLLSSLSFELSGRAAPIISATVSVRGRQ